MQNDIPKRWVEDILDTAEDNYSRFENLVNLLTSEIEGIPVVGTGKSGDLGRDGRSALAGQGVYVLTTLRTDPTKPKKDAGRLKQTTEGIRRVYIYTARCVNEDLLEKFRNAAISELGNDVEITSHGGYQIADLVVSTKTATDAFQKAYSGELGQIRFALQHTEDRDGHIQSIQLALTAFTAKESHELREELIKSVLLILLAKQPASIDELHSAVFKRFGIKQFNKETLRHWCEKFERSKLLDEKSGRYSLTKKGEDVHEEIQREQARAELKGACAVRRTIESSLGNKLTDNQWDRVWRSLQAELASVFYQRGQDMVELINRLIQGKPTCQQKGNDETREEILSKVVFEHMNASSGYSLQAAASFNSPSTNFTPSMTLAMS